MNGDDVRVAYPLFQTERSGSIPTSPLQLFIGEMDIKKACLLNELWHSRLPKITNWQRCFAYSAEYENLFYAVAIWGFPIARLFNFKNYLELRRMAISPDSPRNTASRMLSIMTKKIKKDRPEIVKLISY